MERIDMNAPARERYLKALVYGANGTGKTGIGVSAPRPLILLNEAQAVPNIKLHAQRLGKPQPEVLRMKSTNDYRSVIKACHGDRSKPFVVKTPIVEGKGGDVVLTMDAWPLTLVFDSITEALLVLMEEIRVESPPKIGKDNLPVDSERFWNVFQDRASKLIRSFRDCDMNVLFLALIDDKTIGEGDAAVRSVRPSMSMRKLPDVCAAAVNVVGVTYRKLGRDPKDQKKLVPTYGVTTIGPEYMLTKPFEPLRQIEVMDFTSWCERINGRDDGSESPAAPNDADIQASDGDDSKVEERSTEQVEAKTEEKVETTTIPPMSDEEKLAAQAKLAAETREEYAKSLGEAMKTTSSTKKKHQSETTTTKGAQ